MKVYPYLLILIIFLNGCNLFESEPEKIEQNFIYPLAVGNSWDYSRTISTLYDETGNSNGLNDESYTNTALVEICDQETIFKNQPVYNMKTTINDGGYVINGHNFYNNSETKCMSYGYTAAHVITPKREKKYSHLKFHGRLFRNSEDIVYWLETCKIGRTTTAPDSIVNDPVKIYEYPLVEGNQWTYRSETSDQVPWRIDKQVTGWEEIEVPAGNFWAWKINWYNNPFNEGKDWDETIETVEYVTDQGLVKRTWQISGIEVYNSEGELMGTQTFLDEIELVQYSVAE